MSRRYVKPGWFTRNVFNPVVVFLTRRGLSVWGSREMRVRGRVSGLWRTTPINVLTYQGARYLVAPRGETEWVRNLRASASGELCLGRKAEAFSAVEILSDAEKTAILRAYLKRWKMEVGVFFGGVSANAPDAMLLQIAPHHPVFRLSP